MSFNKIKALLQDRLGLNPDSVGESSIRRAISHRLAHLNIDNNKQYLKVLTENTREINELIEEVVVPETWFFRNKTPFSALETYVRNELKPKFYAGKKVRILSAPCSTGEEPYSIAMIMLECGLTSGQVEIDAIDVSKRALTKARRAIYGKNSFREMEQQYIDNYFTKIRSGWHLNENVRNMVKFKLGNLLLGSLSPHPNYYDIIFCRNLLIYFNRDIQITVLEKLHRSLKESGALFVGHAETSQLERNHFHKYDYPHSFAYIKKIKGYKPRLSENGSGKHLDVSEAYIQSAPKEWQDIFSHLLTISPFQQKTNGSVQKKTHNPSCNKKAIKTNRRLSAASLRRAEKMIQEGDFDEALRTCQEYLQAQSDSAQAYYLMGLIAHSTNNDKKADSMLKKSIYLDPNHEQAMTLALVLAEKRSDKDAIRSYKRRIKRIQERRQRN